MLRDIRFWRGNAVKLVAVPFDKAGGKILRWKVYVKNSSGDMLKHLLVSAWGERHNKQATTYLRLYREEVYPSSIMYLETLRVTASNIIHRYLISYWLKGRLFEQWLAIPEDILLPENSIVMDSFPIPGISAVPQSARV